MYELPHTPDILSAFGSLITGVAALAGATIAGFGLDRWKKQRKWEQEDELARRLFVGFRKRYDAFKGVRGAFFFAGELAKAKRELEDVGTEYDDTTEGATIIRWQRLERIRDEQYGDIIESAALWGVEIETLEAELLRIEQRVLLAQQEYYQLNKDRSTPDARRSLPEVARVAFSSAEDPTHEEYEKVIGDVRQILVRRMDRK
ncbi:hypothetical protein MWU54_15875 [Marivita sp. S6314]|uniref:hypothetical protein n=1 Tax=Marivita sp. S6314 TaxID=2926406 RepID=UPI001FF6956F|nr:hypothetical protein [Marivita sp. S6314]MCK0151521.1 hypothetical protein [Marivita sp. S6314]